MPPLMDHPVAHERHPSFRVDLLFYGSTRLLSRAAAAASAAGSVNTGVLLLFLCKHFRRALET